jgi:hypothetical protein
VRAYPDTKLWVGVVSLPARTPAIHHPARAQLQLSLPCFRFLPQPDPCQPRSWSLPSFQILSYHVIPAIEPTAAWPRNGTRAVATLSGATLQVSTSWQQPCQGGPVACPWHAASLQQGIPGHPPSLRALPKRQPGLSALAGSRWLFQHPSPLSPPLPSSPFRSLPSASMESAAQDGRPG